MQKIVLEVGEGVGVMVGRRRLETVEDMERETGREMETETERETGREMETATVRNINDDFICDITILFPTTGMHMRQD